MPEMRPPSGRRRYPYQVRSTEPARTRETSLRLHREDSARLDRLMDATGMRQSDLIREALRVYEEVRGS